MAQAIKQTAVCMFTAFEEQTVLTKCAALGSCGHILKPLTPLKFWRVVHEVFPNVIPAPAVTTNEPATAPFTAAAENPNPASVPAAAPTA